MLSVSIGTVPPVDSDSVVVVTGDSVWQQVGVSLLGTLGALLVAYVIYLLTRKDEDKRLTKTLEQERVRRQEERGFLALQEIRTALSTLSPALAERNKGPIGFSSGPSIAELVEYLTEVIHLQHVHLRGKEYEACDRLYAAGITYLKDAPPAAGPERRKFTDDLNDFIHEMALYLTARIKGETAVIPAKPPWSR